jgi:spoIIIJ-associated protein
LEEWIENSKQLLVGLLERMGVHAEVEEFLKEGDLCLEIKGDQEGMLIGKNGRTLEALQILINRMINKRVKESVRVVLDINHYRERRADSLTKMATRLGEKAKVTGKIVTIGPYNAHDRRIIHIALQDDSSVQTQSMGDGDLKEISIIPQREQSRTP